MTLIKAGQGYWFLPNLDQIINQIRDLVQEYQQAGLLDPDTVVILQQRKNYAQAQGTRIAPPLAHPRTTTLPSTTETTMTTSTTITDYPLRIQCTRPLGRLHYPTHPLTRGTLRWLKYQAQDALYNPQHQWQTCTHEYQQLINGTHPDPNPGKIITPDNPDSFHPNQINPNKDTDLTEKDPDLLNLPTSIEIVDGYA